MLKIIKEEFIIPSEWAEARMRTKLHKNMQERLKEKKHRKILKHKIIK